MIIAAIGTFFGGLALDLAKAKMSNAISARLSRDSIKEALQMAVGAADGEVPELFAPYERQGLKGIDVFLNTAFRETAIAELKKPLQDEGKPGDALLTEVFLKAAKNHPKLKSVKEKYVAAWMKAFADAYFQTTATFLKFKVVKKNYYKQLSAKTEKVFFGGMAVDGTVVDKSGELTRIFVMPDVQRQTAKGSELVELPLPEIAEDAQRMVLWEQQQQLRLRKDYAAGQTPVSAVELLKEKDERRIVILGAPGAGKTTLINYWVMTATSPQARADDLEGVDLQGGSVSDASMSSALADSLFGTRHCLPVLIRIRDLVREPDLSVLEFLIKFAKVDLEVEEIPTDFFQHWLKRGDALILLDGLDEVGDDAQRHRVVEKIETFLGAYVGCPAIITSRPAGYRDDYFSRKQYPHYELLPFDDDKIETFITHWYDSRVELPTERERRKESLRDALGKKPRIKQLARNPLLLTMIALIHRYRTLPRQRHELYSCAVETLISTWDREKELTTNSELEYLNLPDIRRLMERLAYWIHVQGSVSDAENGTQIERGAMVRQLARFIQEVKASEKLQMYEAKAEAETLLDKVVKDRAGLLSKQGENRYAFVHKTFQEYLCSQEILYLQEDQDRDDDDYVPYAKNHIKQYLHEPHWREVLLLLVAQQKPSPAKASLKTILKAESEYEQWLHRDVLFAGSCLAENAEVSDQGVIDEILTELVSLETSTQPSSARKLRNEVFRVITSLQDTPFALMAMQRLVAHQPPIEQSRLVTYQGKLEPHKAVQQLLQLLKDDNWTVRSSAAESLVQLGQSSKAVIDALVALLKSDDWTVCALAIESLGQLGSSEVVIDALVMLLKDNNTDIRSIAAELLVGLGSSAVLIDALVALLKDDDTDVRSRAAESLGQIGKSSEVVIDALVALLKDDDGTVRSCAAESLGRLGKSSEVVIDALVVLLKDDSDRTVRSCAAESLGRLGKSSEAVIDALVALLKDDDIDVRSRSAESLGQLGHASEAVTDTLVALLKEDNSTVRSRAVESLGRLDQLSEAAINALVALLKENDRFFVHYRTAVLLSQLGSSETVIDTLVALLKDDNSTVRSRSAMLLGQLGQSSEAVIDALVALLKDDDINVRLRAAASLGQLGQSSEVVIDALVTLLRDDDDRTVRSLAAESLGQLGQLSETVVDVLLNLLKDESLSLNLMRTASDRATQSLITLAKKSDTVEPALVQWIEQHQHEAYVGNGIDALWEIAS